jgi:hypothetical protein
MPQQTLTTSAQATQTGREGREGENPDAASPSAEMPRNSSGSRSPAAQILDLRMHVIAIEGVLSALASQGLIADETILPLRRLQQKGFRSGR